MPLDKERWEIRRAAWERALSSVGRALPKGNACRESMGTIAWGRYDGEPSAVDHKDNMAFGAGFLQGARYALLQAARFYDWPEQWALEQVARQASDEETRRTKENRSGP